MIKLTTPKKNKKIQELEIELTEKKYHFKCMKPF